MRRRCAGVLFFLAMLASSPASAQFMCTPPTSNPLTCTNSGNAPTLFTNTATGTNQNATTTNSGTANGFASVTTGGGVATATNSGSNIANGILAQTGAGGGNATVTNTGNDTGIGHAFSDVVALTLVSGDAMASNSGTIGDANAGNFSFLEARTQGSGNATAINSGSSAGGVVAETLGAGNASASNSGTTAGNVAAETMGGGDATATNSGRTAGVAAATMAGGNATATNSGSAGGVAAVTFFGGNATATNSGANTGGIEAVTMAGGNATVTNSGSNSNGISAETDGGGNATVTNSGSNTGGIVAETFGGGNATATNSGTNTGGITATTGKGGGDATVINSGSNGGGLSASAFGSGNATVINSGNTTGGIFAGTAIGNASAINSGVVNGDISINADVRGTATLTNVVGGRVIGAININGATGADVNFVGGNWLFTIGTTDLGGKSTINTGGAPFVVSSTTVAGVMTSQIAVLDPTIFALADRSLTNFTGEISEMLQNRFAGMSTSAGGGALGFAGAPSSPVADQAQAAFSGIPSVAMSYASDARPVLSKAAAAAPYYDTTIWASGFGGERKQRADGVILPTTDTAFGGAMGVDRVLGGNLRLGAFVGAGTSRESVELDVQKIDASYVFGGGYGRFDWISQYLDFSLYGGGIDNKSTRTVANNTVASGIETATASYGGWFISPEHSIQCHHGDAARSAALRRRPARWL
jgi:hypothetical protein